MPTIDQTIEILKNAIPWTRIWLETPVYLHSVAVGELLKKHGFSDDVVYAGYLHDIIEDGNYTLTQLKELGYSDHTIHLVDLSTFELANTDKHTARLNLIQRMIDENDPDVWAVKIADITHNLSECYNCSETQRRGYLFFKAPAFIYYGNKYFADSSLYREFLETYREQVRKYHNYF